MRRHGGKSHTLERPAIGRGAAELAAIPSFAGTGVRAEAAAYCRSLLVSSRRRRELTTGDQSGTAQQSGVQKRGVPMRRQLSQRTMIWSMALGGLLLLILSGQAATPVFADAMDSYDEWNGKDPCTGTGIYPLLQPFFASFKTLSEPYNTNIDRFAAPEVTTTTPGNNRWSRGDVQVQVKAMYCGNSTKVGAYKVRAEITGAEARTAQFTNTWQNSAYSCDLTHPCRAMKVTLD